MKYVKALDGYRALAVLLVIVDHWLPPGHFIKLMPYGFVGVNMFFVLSGFLITSILLKSSDAVQQGQISSSKAFKVFYARRTLRIFPIYYLLLIVLCVFAPSLFAFDPDSKIWLFTYASNIYLYIKQTWIGSLSPLWSLAVEEQFYLVWPLLILFVLKPQHLLKILLAFIIGSFLFRLGCEFAPEIIRRKGFYVVLTPACVDAFGLGALLALFYKQKEEYPRFVKLMAWVTPLSLIALVISVRFFSDYEAVLYRTLVSLLSVGLLILLLDGKNTLSQKVFGNRAMVYIGKISYSVYLFHDFVPTFYQYLSTAVFNYGIKIPLTKYSLLPFTGGYKQLVLYFGFLILLSTISWYSFEYPINKLKKHFHYGEE